MSEPTPRRPHDYAARLGRAVSGRPIDPVTPARQVDDFTFTPLDADGLPKYVTVDDRPDDATIARVTRAYDRQRDLARSVDTEVDERVAAMDDIEIPVTVGDLTVVHRGRIPRQRGSYLVAVLGLFVTLGLVLGLSPVSVSTAQAATVTASVVAVEGPGLKLAPGKNHKGKLHAGAYLLAGHTLYCVDYGYQSGDGRVGLADRDPMQTYIVDKWGDTQSASQAASVYLAVNSLLGNPKFDADLPGYLRQLPDKGARVGAMVAEAKRLAGPWTVQVMAPKAAPGATVQAQVVVKSAAGNPVSGVPVRVSAVGAKVAGGSTTGTGVVAIQVTPTALTYTLTASVAGPWGKVWTNAPSKGRQRLVGAGPNSTASGTACATVCPVSARITIDAPCEGSDKHALDVQYTAEAIPGTYRAVVTINGTRNVTELNSGETRTVSTVIADGDTVTVGWEILDSAGQVVAERTLYRSER